jgi:hypothetical protein
LPQRIEIADAEVLEDEAFCIASSSRRAAIQRSGVIPGPVGMAMASKRQARPTLPGSCCVKLANQNIACGSALDLLLHLPRPDSTAISCFSVKARQDMTTVGQGFQSHFEVSKETV